MNSNKQRLSYWLKKQIKKAMNVKKVPTVHVVLCADGGSVKSWGGWPRCIIMPVYKQQLFTAIHAQNTRGLNHDIFDTFPIRNTSSFLHI